MTDLARARALARELLEALGEEKEPKRQVDVVYEDGPDGRPIVRRVYSDGSEKLTTLPVVHRGPEGAG